MLNLLLRNIRLNKETDEYIAREAGSSYSIYTSLIDNLVNYLKENPGSLIAHWCRSLTPEYRAKVKKHLAASLISLPG